MNSQNKYLKYKKKYLELINQSGGYYLSDENPGYLLGKLLTIIKPNSDYFNFINETTKIKNFDETYDFLMTDIKYNSIINYLLKTYTFNQEYEQVFTKENGEVISNNGMILPYHINFGAFMFLSFIIDLEIFTLFHSLIGYNTILKPTTNNLETAFCHATDVCTLSRIYKQSVNLPIVDKLKLFTKTLDDIFNNFMNILVKKLSVKYTKTIAEIYSTIVPIEHSIHKLNTFDFIYINWKDRIIKLVGLQRGIIQQINIIIKESIDKIEENSANYIAESTGFFSFIFMNYPGKADVLFGSCITYSMFELYIMSRLHIHANNLNLLVEKEHEQPHQYWNISQERSNIPVLTHFATHISLSEAPFKLRSLLPLSKELNFNNETDKKNILKVLIYIIYDMYIVYINTNNFKYNEKQKQNIPKIMLFIQKRIEEIENFFITTELTGEEVKQFLIKESNRKDIFKNISLDKILSQSNILHVLSTMNILELLHNSFNNINYEFIKKILSIGIDINKKYINKDKDKEETLLTAILHNHVDINDLYIKDITEIINLLLLKGAKLNDKYINIINI